jgi:hypothetical protein
VHHDGVGAGVAREPGVRDGGVEVETDARDDDGLGVRGSHHDGEHVSAFARRERIELARVAVRGEGRDTVLHEPPGERGREVEVDGAVFVIGHDGDADHGVEASAQVGELGVGRLVGGCAVGGRAVGGCAVGGRAVGGQRGSRRVAGVGVRQGHAWFSVFSGRSAATSSSVLTGLMRTQKA